MVAAGLLAKKAVEKGLTVPPHVKTSLAPGSRVVTDYFEKAGLDTYLEKVGFYTVGYGCTTCIGNSGPLPEPIADAVKKSDLVVAGVLSGNRNFEGRINPDVKANYLASPPLVVAYALAGTTDIDFEKQPIGAGTERLARLPARHLADARRSASASSTQCVLPEMFEEAIRRRLEQEPQVERHQNERRRAVRLGSGQHLHSGAAVLDRPRRRTGPDQADHRRALPRRRSAIR